MIVKSLSLRHYRNYESLSLEFDPGLNILTGNNAQGKTNLLESLVFLSITRSHRLNKDEQLIQKDQLACEMECNFMDRVPKRIGAVITNQGKTLFVERQPVKRSSEFIGLLNVVLFAPDDLGIFSDSPKVRRRLMNQEITKISPKYLLALTQYQNLLKERNILLKNHKPDESYLDVLDQQMIEKSVSIIRARRKFIYDMNQLMPQIYRSLSEETGKVHLNYVSCINNDEADIQVSLQTMYSQMRSKDLEYHVTSNGIHREDMGFELNDENVCYVASQGQKRMIMLSFKMSLLKFIEETTGKRAVFLMDDVLSELDANRQRKLMEMVSGHYQCLITTTEIPEYLKALTFNTYEIENGTIIKQERNEGSR